MFVCWICVFSRAKFLRDKKGADARFRRAAPIQVPVGLMDALPSAERLVGAKDAPAEAGASFKKPTNFASSALKQPQPLVSAGGGGGSSSSRRGGPVVHGVFSPVQNKAFLAAQANKISSCARGWLIRRHLRTKRMALAGQLGSNLSSDKDVFLKLRIFRFVLFALNCSP